MKRWLKILIFQSRPVNLIITTIVLFYSAFLANNYNINFISHKEFYYELIVILVLMATGYWTNDAFDIKIDIYKKRDKNLLRSRKEAIILIIFSQVLAAIIIIISFFIKVSIYIKIINVLAYLLLFFYSSILKRISPIGNVIIALLSMLVIYVPALMYGFKEPIGWLAVFAFGITFLRELTKDLEDLHPDLQAGRKTLPILIGTKKTHYFLIFSYIIFFIILTFPVIYHLTMHNRFLLKYFVAITILVIIPLITNILNLKSGVPNYKKQSLVLKLVIFGGLISVYFIN